MPGHLVAILHSLPTGSGARTRARIDLAAAILGCGSASIANLYPAQLSDSGALRDTLDVEVWKHGRLEIAKELARADTSHVLLGYGVQLVTGANRAHHRLQIEWVHEMLQGASFSVWQVDGRPLHPSRWQRATHRVDPYAPLASTLPRVLMRS